MPTSGAPASAAPTAQVTAPQRASTVGEALGLEGEPKLGLEGGESTMSGGGATRGVGEVVCREGVVGGGGSEGGAKVVAADGVLGAGEVALAARTALDGPLMTAG